MATLVGTQDCFKTALSELLELEYDALEAYNAAIERFKNQLFKTKFLEFKSDHERHIRELTSLFKLNNEKAPTGPSAKQWLTKGKVVLANLIDDTAILKAMLTNEEDTNTAYQRLVNHDEKWPDAEDILERAYADERKHKRWIETTLENK